MSGGSGTNVNRAGLLAQAKVWDGQSQTMGTISGEVAGCKMTTSGWPWNDAITAYNQVVAQIGGWSSEGAQQMLAICGALCTAAARYGATEEQIVSASDGVFH